MSVYVDPLMDHGWVLRGHPTLSCHMFTDEVCLATLHAIAKKIGMKRSWFQAESTPHYDLTPARREAAVLAGAINVGRREAVAIWRARRLATSPEPGQAPGRDG